MKAWLSNTKWGNPLESNPISNDVFTYCSLLELEYCSIWDISRVGYIVHFMIKCHFK